MNLYEKFQQGLRYADFLARYGSDVHQGRWQALHAQVVLTPVQRQLLAAFKRQIRSCAWRAHGAATALTSVRSSTTSRAPPM